jgi:hypothetical protein
VTPAQAVQRKLHSYLLRVTVERGARRYLLQDLRSGERHEFDDERELKRFLAEHRPARLR